MGVPAFIWEKKTHKDSCFHYWQLVVIRHIELISWLYFNISISSQDHNIVYKA